MSYSWAERLKRKNEKNDNRLDTKFDDIIDITKERHKVHLTFFLYLS